MKYSFIAIVFASFIFTGCLTKTLTITSTPSGALVSINDIEIGSTPVTTKWHGGGAYRFELKLKDYNTLTKVVNINPKWYGYPVIDMGADFMTTKKITDHKTLHFDMQKMQKVDLNKIKQQALNRKKMQ